MSKHAKRSPSGSPRWMPCPGSIALCDQVPKVPTSDYAKEGTAAHELAALALNDNRSAAFFMGRHITVEGKRFIVDEEMCEAVQVYLDAVRGDLGNCLKEYMTLEVEKLFDLSWLCEDMHGTVDCVIYDKEKKKLIIYDYKHGQGVLVVVEWNSQLLMYALGALYKAWDIEEMLPVNASVEEVEIVIAQPRIETEDGPIRRWTIPTGDLLYWGLHVLKPSALRTMDPNAKLVAGDHCRFCDAAAVCPEKAKQACALAKTDFAKPIFPAPEQLTPEQVTDIMNKAGMFSKWQEQVEAFAFAQMQRGVPYPGRKLVKRKSNRIWVDGGTGVVKALGDDAYTKKVVSPAQAEKILKKLDRSPEAELEGLWEKPDNGVTMALDTDKRAEVAAPAAQDFLADADFLQ